MTRDSEPIGIRQSYIDGSLSIIGADGWPYTSEETVDLLRDTSGPTLQLLERVLDALCELAGATNVAPERQPITGTDGAQ